MKIKLRFSCQQKQTITVDTKSDFGMSDKEWQQLSESQRSEMLRDAADESEQPWWEIDSADEF